MSETNATPAAPTAAPKAKLTAEEFTKKRNDRRTSRKEGREKTAKKLASDKEFAKTYFAARSKRSVEKKAAFRKKKTRKK